MAEWKGPVKPISVRLPDDLHQTVRMLATSKRVTLEAAYTEALECWLAEGQVEKEPEDPALADVREILEKGQEETISWLLGNVRVFLSEVRRNPRPRPRGRRPGKKSA